MTNPGIKINLYGFTYHKRIIKYSSHNSSNLKPFKPFELFKRGTPNTERRAKPDRIDPSRKGKFHSSCFRFKWNIYSLILATGYDNVHENHGVESFPQCVQIH